MPKYRVPVSWVMAGTYVFEAESVEDAIKKAYLKNLPQEPVYADGFMVHEESIEIAHDDEPLTCDY
jgi:hypothetical protein